MANKGKSKISVFYRVVRAENGHPFSGLYAVEKVFFRDGEFLKKQIVHEWDLRIISEAVLARLGGQDAYETFKIDRDVDKLALDPETKEIGARDPADLALTKRKLNAELRLKPENPE